MANYPSETPQDLTLSLLKHITHNFSDGVLVGRGGFGDVYWGIYRDEKIAVKKLYDQNPGFNDAAFKKEFNNSLKLRHSNIVRLVGYCHETRMIHTEVKPGEYAFVRRILRIVCFEYCQGGSLDKYIYEKFSEHDLDTRLKIIRGISEGLDYLHNGRGQGQHMYHMDLKPENILLDENNMPKIANFGLSRFLANTKTQNTKTHCMGTMGYMPPEYLDEKMISSKFDVFSFGVIILQILAVPLGYSIMRRHDEMSPRYFVEQVRRNWYRRPPMIPPSESYRVKKYIDIALRCVEKERDKRPKIRDIKKKLENLDTQHSATIQTQIKEVGDRNHRYRTGVTSTKDSHEMIDIRAQAIFKDASEIVGIDEQKNELINLLIEDGSSSQHQTKVVSVVGPGGLGKTTLANQVYESLKHQFECWAFVTVSPTPHMMEVLRTILRDFSGQEYTGDMQHLIKKISDFLQDKRYLIVVDDLWDSHSWERIQYALVKNSCASRIITTTRKLEVAESCCSSHWGHVYKLRSLNLENSRKLFRRRIFGSEEGCPSCLTEVYDDIVENCNGLPLAIIAMAGLFASRAPIVDELNKVQRSFGTVLKPARPISGYGWDAASDDDDDDDNDRYEEEAEQEEEDNDYDKTVRQVHASRLTVHKPARPVSSYGRDAAWASSGYEEEVEQEEEQEEEDDNYDKEAQATYLSQSVDETTRIMQEFKTQAMICVNDDRSAKKKSRVGRCVDDKQIRSFGGCGLAPQVMPLELLRKITNDFSDKRKLGSGTFGTVYKGVLNGGKEVAVKVLHGHSMPRKLEEEFMKEFENVRRLNHPNIVQLLGFCYETKLVVAEYEGKYVLADKIDRALCFEYMHNGNLKRHLDNESHGLDWQTRYKIIKGTCEGLNYLHKGLETPMLHLDLKPQNILLDKNMVPKLADFGLSKLVNDNQTQETSSPLGTIRYCPPEHFKGFIFSNKFDIFSLGVVMLEIIAGPKGYDKIAEMPPQKLIDHVQENWRKRIHQATPGSRLPNYECRQMKRCIEIALECVHPERMQRPNIEDIISGLNETENNTEKSGTT